MSPHGFFFVCHEKVNVLSSNYYTGGFMNVNWPLLGIFVLINVVLGVIGWFLPPIGLVITLGGTIFIFCSFLPSYRKNRLEGLKVSIGMTAAFGGACGWLAPITSTLLHGWMTPLVSVSL